MIAAIIIAGLASAIAARTLVALCRLAVALAERLGQPAAAGVVSDAAGDREAERLGGRADARAVHASEIVDAAA